MWVQFGTSLAALRLQESDASGALAAVGSDALLRPRASILEEQRNCPKAREALRALIARIVPAESSLNNSQKGSQLRVVTTAAQAGDCPCSRKCVTRTCRVPPGSSFRSRSSNDR